MSVRSILIAALLWLPLAVSAQTAQPTTDDPVANKRAVQLSEELRSGGYRLPVCLISKFDR